MLSMELVKQQFGLCATLDDGSALGIGHIIGIGRNYAEHAAEQGIAPPDRPMIFTKNPASACLSGDEIVIPVCCQDREQVDFEGELAFIVGRPCRDVSEEQAADPSAGFILGYVVANDVSARWWQKEGAGGQFCRGKSYDTFCPLSTRIASPHEVGDPMSLTLITTVSGETMQHAKTSAMTFSPACLLAELSRGTTLAPGTLILTGTPSGVGMSRTPPRYLREGDTVEITIGTESEPESVGLLTNTVRLERTEPTP